MSNIEIFLKNLCESNMKLYIIIDDLIKDYKFKILDDSVLNDYRTINLRNTIWEEIKIVSTIIFGEDYTNKLEYIQIYYRSNKSRLEFKFTVDIS
jgi:hypothetical protein